MASPMLNGVPGVTRPRGDALGFVGSDPVSAHRPDPLGVGVESGGCGSPRRRTRSHDVHGRIRPGLFLGQMSCHP